MCPLPIVIIVHDYYDFVNKTLQFYQFFYFLWELDDFVGAGRVLEEPDDSAGGGRSLVLASFTKSGVSSAKEMLCVSCFGMYH